VNRGFRVSKRGLRPSRLPLYGCLFALAGALALPGCTGQEAQPVAAAAGVPGASGGPLYAQGLSDIGDLYIEPISTRRVAIAGATRLAKLDNKIGVSGGFGAGFGDAISVSYEGRVVAYFAVPPERDSKQWGDLLASIVATSKQVSPSLAAAAPAQVDKAIFEGMTGALDRFSRYSDPDVARDQRADRNGYGGIGITFDKPEEVARVTAVTPGGPADRAGLRPEDRLLAVDGVPTAGRTHEEIVFQLRGASGTPLTLRVQPYGSAAVRDLHLQRAFVTTASVSLTRNGNIAVFKVTSFNNATTGRIADGLREIQKPGAPPVGGIVLDLRNNPGGLLEQAASVADLFIHDGIIASTEGRHPAARQRFTASGRAIAPRVPIVVLINGASASSAEIVASALQDTGRGVILGSSSYGKGSVQTVMRLANNGELILTWARLVTPAGYRLQRHGVVPTICTATAAADVAAPRAVVLGGLAPRAGLDDKGWVALRETCPSRPTSPAIDLKIAEELLADPKLYAQALEALPKAAAPVKSAAADEPAGDAGATRPSLTDVKRTLSFEAR